MEFQIQLIIGQQQNLIEQLDIFKKIINFSTVDSAQDKVSSLPRKILLSVAFKAYILRMMYAIKRIKPQLKMRSNTGI